MPRRARIRDRRAGRRRGWTGSSLALLCLALLVAAPGGAAGQSRTTGWRLSVMAGSALGADLRAGGTDRTLAGALALGRERVTLEAEVATTPRLRWHSVLAVQLGTAALLYHPIAVGRVTPYGLVAASIGRLHDRRDSGATTIQPALDLGGGGWVALRGPLAARVDLRFVHIDDAPNFWRATAGLTVRLR